MSSKNGWSRRTLPITDVKLVIMVDAELDQLLDVVGRKLRLTKSSLARMAICRLTEDALTREMSREDTDEPLLKRFFCKTMPAKEKPASAEGEKAPKGFNAAEVLGDKPQDAPLGVSKEQMTKLLLLAARGATKQEDLDEIFELMNSNQ